MRASWMVVAAACLAASGAWGQAARTQPAQPRITINVAEHAGGYVVVRPATAAGDPKAVAALIGQTLERWLVARPRKVRTALPIVSGGNTVAVHLWVEPAAAPPKAATRVRR